MSHRHGNKHPACNGLTVRLGWHDPMREPCTCRLERVSCGKLGCSLCKGTKPAHGPYWYAYWETGGRRRPRMHKRYIGRASATASPEELRAIFELRQQRRAEATERKRRRDTRSHTGSSTSGDCSEPGGVARTGRSASGSANAGMSGGTGSTRGAGSAGSAGRNDRSRSDRSDRTKNDPFSRRKPPPTEEAFANINAKRGATFEETRQAYREAAQRAHPDRGGDVESMQRINIAWDRIKQSFGR